jgi:hypothetical protein
VDVAHDANMNVVGYAGRLNERRGIGRESTKPSLVCGIEGERSGMDWNLTKQSSWRIKIKKVIVHPVLTGPSTNIRS